MSINISRALSVNIGNPDKLPTAKVILVWEHFMKCWIYTAHVLGEPNSFHGAKAETVAVLVDLRQRFPEMTEMDTINLGVQMDDIMTQEAP